VTSHDDIRRMALGTAALAIFSLVTGLEEAETALDWKALAAHFRFYCQHYDLKERMSEVV
jgi:hypothetical protein